MDQSNDLTERTFTIVPIKGMEVVQKNFSSLGQNCDLMAEEFIKAKKLTLARRFQLIERGYSLQLKNDGRKTMFDQIDVRITYDDNSKQDDDLKSKNAENVPPLLEGK